MPAGNISFTYPKDEGGDFGTKTAPQFLICPAKGLSYLSDGVWGPILKRVASNGLALDHLIAWPYGTYKCSRSLCIFSSKTRLHRLGWLRLREGLALGQRRLPALLHGDPVEGQVGLGSS